MKKMRRHMAGVAAVELALVSIPLVFITLATIDFARAMFVYDQLDKAVRDGARYLSFFDPNDPQNYPVAAAKNRMLYGSVAGGGSTIVPGLTASMISVCDSVDASACPGDTLGNVSTGTGKINLVKVTISGYVFNPLFPGASHLPTMTVGPISVTMRQLFP